jgi:hypothetical protein
MMASNARVEAVLPDFDSGVGVLGLSVSIRDRRLVVEGSMDGALLADWVWAPEINLIISL